MFYGLVLLGAVLVPVASASGLREVRMALRQSGARVVIVANWQKAAFDFDSVLDMRSEYPELEHVIAVGDRATPTGVLDFHDLLDTDPLSEPAIVDPAAPAVIGWTSGTTGVPKGVLLSHRALCADSRLHMSPLLDRRSHPLVSTSPVSHVTGMLISVLVPPLLGQDIHLLDYWDPGQVLALMISEDLSAGSGAPLFLASLLDHPDCTPAHHSLIEMAPLGGASVPPDLITRADDLGVRAWRGYGCTEHPSISLGRPDQPLHMRANTDGTLCTGVEVRIVDDAGIDVTTGHAGEILSRGPDLFSGYTDASLNAEAFAHGWYRTGDIGAIDDDGCLSVLDRKKDIIIRSGLNISAAEVESVLISMPQVSDVAVVAAPDPRTGEHACAFIRPAPGFDAPSVAEIAAHMAAAQISKYKWPEEVRHHAADFPRTPAGKVRKSDLRASLRVQTPH
ncbi:Short-chain-fatty-acid--CoA ligase [Gordonia insulae]|uniref:Short-chain-fatty-acid--CoA ligase n=1 Tax=Gordonia insulae TaxID=2420509 RepID=A0A3G8JKF1_9ACTN|nr:Short-chain-fatty-acid--CoA ligase [Gordonia insulae]